MKTRGILHLLKHVTESATQRLSHTRATQRVRKCRSGGTRTDMNLHKEQLPGGDLDLSKAGQRLLQTALSSPPARGRPAVPRLSMYAGISMAYTIFERTVSKQLRFKKIS